MLILTVVGSSVDDRTSLSYRDGDVNDSNNRLASISLQNIGLIKKESRIRYNHIAMVLKEIEKAKKMSAVEKNITQRTFKDTDSLCVRSEVYFIFHFMADRF